MAAPITTTATTAEGQLLQVIEGITNLQVAAINAAGANSATVRRMITQNVSDDIAGTKTVTLTIPINVEVNAAGTAITAAVVYA